MGINPNDYDPNELRNTGDDSDGGVFLGESREEVGGGPSPGSGPNPVAANEALQSNQYRELFMLEQVTGDGGMEKPYLDTLPRSYAAELVVFEWLEFLVDRTGFRRTLDVLRYYRSIDWITQDAETHLREYLQSFDDGGNDERLDRSDHLLSLVYIARLAAMD